MLVWLSTRRSGVQIPLGALQSTGLCSPWWPVNPLSVNVGVVDARFNSFTTHFSTARSTFGEVACLSRRQEGFDSPTGHCLAKWWNQQTHEAQTLALRHGAWECNSPLGHSAIREVDWRLVPARSHKPSHAGSNPALATDV